MAFESRDSIAATPNKVKLVRPTCIAYGHPDLEKTDKYITDFGLVKSFERDDNGVRAVYYRGYGVQPVVYIAYETPEPKFLGVYFEAATAEDLQKAAKLPGASEILDFVEDGQVVHIEDPSGMPFHVVFGMKTRDFTPRENEIEPQNYPAPSDSDEKAKPRRGKFHRLTRGIIPAHKLGHCGYVAENLDEASEFYSTHFNFKLTDMMVDPAGGKSILFFHVDLGQEYSDHHSFFLAAPMGPFRPGMPHHAAFEVESIDTQFIGHDYLESQGYKPFWGVGRHIEGSQVFDYWFDLDGFLLEHYADGDLVNEDTPINIVPIKHGNGGSNWGPAPNLGAAHSQEH